MEKSIAEKIANVIVELSPAKKKGRPRRDTVQMLLGIVYILETGAQWRNLPSEHGKKSTVHGTMIRWIKEGIFEKIFHYARSLYVVSRPENARNNWFAIDCSTKKAPLALSWSGNNPTDRSKKGIKQALIVDRKGEIMAIYLAGAHVHDSQFLKPILECFQSPDHLSILAADSAFDAFAFRKFCAQRNIALIASRNPRNSSNKHTFSVSHRWVIERTFGWLSHYRSLKVCWTKSKSAFLAFIQIVASIRLFKASLIFG